MSIAKTESKPNYPTSEVSEARYRMTPKYGVWTKDNKIIIQVAVPGVKKEDIDMKILPNYFTLRARRDDVLYSLDLETVKLEPEISEAKYEEGLLKIELTRYNPLEHAFTVKIE